MTALLMSGLWPNRAIRLALHPACLGMIGGQVAIHGVWFVFARLPWPWRILAGAAAVAAAVNGEAFYCEWYGSVCDKAGKTYAEVTKRMLAVAIQHRRHHKGYMADFETALGLVLVEREHVGVTAGMLAAWF